MDQEQKPYKTLTFGKIKITVLAFTMLLVGIAFSVFCLFFLPSTVGVIASLLIMLGFIFAAYNINCVLVGHCVVWAYVLIVIYVFNVVAVILKMNAAQPKLQGKLTPKIAIKTRK